LADGKDNASHVQCFENYRYYYVQLGTSIVGVGDVGLEVYDETLFIKRTAYGKGAPYTACTQYDGSTEGEEVLAMLVRDSIVDRLEAALLPVLRVCCDANESSVTLYRMKLNSQFCHRLQLVKYLTSMHARPSWLQYLTVWRNWEPLYAPTTTPMLRTASVETGGTVRFSETVGAAWGCRSNNGRAELSARGGELRVPYLTEYLTDYT